MKSIPLQAWQALRAAVFLDSSSREGGKVVSPYALVVFTSQEIPPVLIFVRGHTIAQLVQALRYKSEGRGFDSHGGAGIFH
jgi:hypothetical protein